MKKRWITMMDFNLILLIVGLGFLLLFAICVLFGCFAGLKKELNCAAVTFVVLLLAILVFGDSSIILNINGSKLNHYSPLETKVNKKSSVQWWIMSKEMKDDAENAKEQRSLRKYSYKGYLR